MTAQDSTLFEIRDGKPFFRGLPVQRYHLTLRGRLFCIDALADAADLLDEADYARRFVEEDVAPYGLELWPAAIMLCEHVLAVYPKRRKAVIELGCGLGFVSIVLAAHDWCVEATDYESTALAFAHHNARLNGVDSVLFAAFDWRDPPAGSSYDMVLASDVLYQLVDHAPFLACIHALLTPGGVAYIADPNRGVADRFGSAAEAHGFQVETVSVSTQCPHGKTVKGRIFRLCVEQPW